MSALRGGANPVEITSAEQFANVIGARVDAATNETPSLAGKPYCPGSGTEGLAFENTWCCECHYYGPKTEPDCPILQQAYTIADANDPGWPNQWRYDEQGRPSCAAFIERHECHGDHRLCAGTRSPKAERAAYERAMQGDH